MIILTPDNFKKLDSIQKIIGDNYPDIVVYKEIISKKIKKFFIRQIFDILESKKYTYSSPDTILFSDNPEIKNSNVFPSGFSYLKDKIKIITGYNFNSCVLKKYGSLYSYPFLDLDLENQQNQIIPCLVISGSRLLEYKRKKTSTSLTEEHDQSTIDFIFAERTLLIQRPSVAKYWKTNLITDSDSTSFYTLTFYELQSLTTQKSVCPVIKIPKNKILLSYSLKRIYSNTIFRTIFREKIRKSLEGIHNNINPQKQCINSGSMNMLSNYIKIINLLGKGDWGNVYSGCLKSEWNLKNKLQTRQFALKMARITTEDFNHPYSNSSLAWYEIWMMKDIFVPLITRNICPNLPLYIETFLCNQCDFIFKKGKEKHPCITNIMELGSGDFRDFLLSETTHPDPIIYSAFFQILAALHAIQITGQIMNNDIKARNILYYDTIPGGYWVYKINGINFYVPNMGKIFILTDFGVSTLYNPNFQLFRSKSVSTFNLGSRYAININGTFSPFNSYLNYNSKGQRQDTKIIKWNSSVSKGSTFRLKRSTGEIYNCKTVLTSKQKNFLFQKKIDTNPKKWNFFENPHIIPPFEFYNDVQDVLRTFTGGKRATQRGNHTSYPSISTQVKNTIRPYLGTAENAKQNQFSLRVFQVLAGEFITTFFSSKSCNYRKKIRGKKIAFYDMNNDCMKSITQK